MVWKILNALFHTSIIWFLYQGLIENKNMRYQIILMFPNSFVFINYLRACGRKYTYLSAILGR